MMNVVVIVVHLLMPPATLDEQWKQLEKDLHSIMLQERQKKIYVKLSPRRVKRACHEYTCEICGQKLS